MRLARFNNEVFFTKEDIFALKKRDIEFLKKKAFANPRKRVRICAHKNIEDKVHEMIIVHIKGTYVRPHAHMHKSESFHIVEGNADVILFNNAGKIVKIAEMGGVQSGCTFYFRISKPYYHSLLIHSDFLVFHETAKGPFSKADTHFAPWAPDDNDIQSQREFVRNMLMAAGEFKCKHKRR